MNYIFLDGQKDEYTLGYIKDNKLKKIDIAKEESKLGNIYISKVINYVSSLKAYFIEYEKGEKGFLKQNQIPYKIKPGDEILVQYIKEVEKGKCPQFTCNYKLLGKNIIYMPYKEDIELPEKIEKSLKEEISRNLENNQIDKKVKFRKIQKDFSIDKIIEEYNRLDNLNKYLKMQSKFLPIPRLIYRKSNKKFNFINENFKDLNFIICNDKDISEELKYYYKDEIEVKYDKNYIYKYDENISKDIENITKKKIELENGGNIIIENTVAMTVVDVNTSSASNEKDRNKLFYETNLEAVKELILQLELRNIQGIIVVDGINMKDFYYEKINGEIKKILEDYPRINYYGKTQLNLLEFTRSGIRVYE